MELQALRNLARQAGDRLWTIARLLPSRDRGHQDIPRADVLAAMPDPDRTSTLVDHDGLKLGAALAAAELHARS